MRRRRTRCLRLGCREAQVRSSACWSSDGTTPTPRASRRLTGRYAFRSITPESMWFRAGPCSRQRHHRLSFAGATGRPLLWNPPLQICWSSTGDKSTRRSAKQAPT